MFISDRSTQLRPQMISDTDLLNSYIQSGSETAFAELVNRHGPMVRHLCQQIIGMVPDAEDAYQATFWVLARRAADIQDPSQLRSWLYGVASRTARKTRVVSLTQMSATLEEEPADHARDPLKDISLRELKKIISEELNALPKEQRDALVIHYLEGETHETVAKRIGRPIGSVAWVLNRGREALRDRLCQRGIQYSIGMILLFMATASNASASASTISVDSPGLNDSDNHEPLTTANNRPQNTPVETKHWFAFALMLLAVLFASYSGYSVISANTLPVAVQSPEEAPIAKAAGGGCSGSSSSVDKQ